MDPLTSNSGEPYGPKRYREIVRECYLIAKNIHTPYTALMNITPKEREYLIRLAADDARKYKESIEKTKTEIQAKQKR